MLPLLSLSEDLASLQLTWPLASDPDSRQVVRVTLRLVSVDQVRTLGIGHIRPKPIHLNRFPFSSLMQMAVHVFGPQKHSLQSNHEDIWQHDLSAKVGFQPMLLSFGIL